MQRKREYRKAMADGRKTAAAVVFVCIILIFVGMILVSLYYAREKEEGTEKSVAESNETGESGMDELEESGNRTSDEHADPENEASAIGQNQPTGKDDGASQENDENATIYDGISDTDDGNNTDNSSGENGEKMNDNSQSGENGNNAGDNSSNGGTSNSGSGTSNGGSSNGGSGTSNGDSSNGGSDTSNGGSYGDGGDTSNGTNAGSEPSTGSSGGESSSDTTDAKIQKIIDNMPLEEKVAQLFIVTPEQLTGVGTATVAGETTRKAIEVCPVGGIIYFAKNIKSAEQIRTMLKNTQQYFEDRCGFQAFLMVDEEGGQVTRIGGKSGFSVPTFENLSVIGARGDTNEAYELGSQIGAYLSDLGFNLDTAPVADVLTNPENTVVKYRSFGSDCSLVSKMAKAEWQGLASENVIGIYKHFPGHGGTSGDTHKGYAYVTDTLEELEANALVPFRDAINAGVQVIMVGHISCPNVTGDETPASLSKMMITDILREDMGFNGIVITDALDMDAIAAQYTSAEAAVKALQAGADLLLMPADFDAAYQGVLEAVSAGTITEERVEESLVRILQVKLKM
ncbi:MAG: hypothetical protein LUE29_01035 [Lachnospiraceae bacterium]|nr:hypothetical protein [Lachnospiraceae bacterium]